ncbi:E3 ubiquitin-protein ligase At4g11680-like [Silene latifolia]|uniref:E3 ubiquitin-protein ligase At4g11680-like n=1 Tax=Silene latifolia TaxID=37657 RepID=UPI003D789B91
MSTTETTNPIADTTAAPLLSSTNTDIHRSLGGGCIADLARPASCRPEPVSLIFELIWSTIIVSVAIVVLAVLSKGETTEVPLRVWIVGFVILRVLRMVCVCLDYSNRRQVWEATILDPENTRKTALGRVSKCLHTVNIVLNIIWWIVGLYWMFSGGKSLADDAPKLFWSTVIFLALDLLVVVIFAFVSCFICVGCYCCLQLIMSTESSIPNQVQGLFIHV